MFLTLACATAVPYLIFEPKNILKHLKNGALTAVQNTNTALVALASATGFGGVVASGFSASSTTSGSPWSTLC